MIEFSTFRLDALNQCLWRFRDGEVDERVLLPPKAFAVLRYLVERAGRLVTEDELLSAVWSRAHVQPEAVKSQLHEIRKVLGDDPKVPRFIETLPRRGYRFIAPVRDGPVGDLGGAAAPRRVRLVGRDRALATLLDWLRAASRGQRQIIFIRGEAGIGKTALVDELRHRVVVELPGLRIARGQCIEGYGGTEAYYPMLEALGQMCRGSGSTSIIEILASQAPTWLVQFPALITREHRENLRQEILGATRERMVREIGVALETISTDAPLLLEFEDLQWLDHSTADVLSALARRRTPARLMLIATKRPLDAVPSGHPLKELKQDLLLRKLCHELQLEALTQADVTEYLAAESSPDTLPNGLAELVHRHSGGNPLFMVAVLEHMTQRGFISKLKGIWQLTVPLEAMEREIPEGLRQMIEAQIERLSIEEQRALEVASIAGTAFSGTLAAAAVDSDVENFEALYETLARRHRVVRSVGLQPLPDGSISARYEFVHALYREVLYRRQSPARRAKLHRRSGERLEALYAQQLSRVGAELAYHFEESADWPRAISYLRLAADTAEQRYSHGDAIALLERALPLTAKLAGEQATLTEIGILETLASIYFLSLDARAPDAYEALASRAARCGAINVEVRALLETALLWQHTHSPRCLEFLDRAQQLSARQLDPLARAGARMHCAHWRIEAGGWDPKEAAAYREALLQMRAADDPSVLAPHLAGYSHIQFMSSEYRASRRSAQEALATLTAGTNGNPCANLPQIIASFALYINALFLGEWGEALREIEATIRALTKNGNDIFAQGLQFWRAWLSVLAMDYSGALAICESAAQALGDTVVPPSRRMYLAVAGTAEVALGQYESGLEHLSLACHEMERRKVVYDWYTRLLVEWALTELHLAKGDLVPASVQSERVLELTLATAERTWQALAWEASARVAMAAGDLVRAQERIAKALQTIDGQELPLAAWRIHAAAAALDELMGHGESAQDHREIARTTILKIADSLESEDPLRMTFLSSAPAVEILAVPIARQHD